MKKITTLLWLLAIGISLGACTNKQDKEVMGYAPLYLDEQHIPVFHILPPQPIVKAGKIYIQGNRLFQLEQGTGIHVLDISQSVDPKALGFIPIGGAQEISIKDQFLYTNQYNDLLVIDISNLDDIKTLTRLPNSFKLQEGSLPPEPGYFDCVDPKKGSVIGWEKKLLHNPRCHY